MKPRAAMLAALLAATLLPGVAQAQAGGKSITLGATSMRLGDRSNKLLPELLETYEVSPAPAVQGEAETWLVRERTGSPAQPIAAISFDRKGRLLNATRFWLPESRAYSPEDIGFATYGVVNGFVKDRTRDCRIGTSDETNSAEATETRHVFVRCGLKLLSISMMRQQGVIRMDVSETLLNERAASMPATVSKRLTAY